MFRKLLATSLGAAMLLGLSSTTALALTATTTTVSLNPAATRIAEGKDVVFLIAISPRPSTSVTIGFSDDEVPGWSASTTYPASTSGIMATWATPPAGPHAIRVSFPGTSTLAPSVSTPVVFSVVRPTTTTVTREFLGGRTYRITAAVTPAPPAGDPIDIKDNRAADGVLATLALDADGTATADYELSDTYHDVRAAYGGSDAAGLAASTSASMRVPASTVVKLTADAASFVVTAGAGMFAEVTGGDGTPVDSGTIDFYTVTGAGDVLVATGEVEMHVRDSGIYYGAVGYGMGLPLGDSTIVARYAGSANHEMATSSSVTVTGLPDTKVLVGEYALNRTTFYPVKDGYRDTVALYVTANEQGVTGTTAVYNSSGVRVRTLRTGAFSDVDETQVTWNGRTAGGTLLASGTYSIRSTFRDASGNATTRSVKVALSHKRLVTHSLTYSRVGESYSTTDRDGAGWVSRAESAWSTGVLLDSGQGSTGYNRAGVAYRFTVPTHNYTSVKFSVLGRNVRGRASVGPWDGEPYFDSLKVKQVTSGYAWSSVIAPAAYGIHNGRACGYVLANGYYNSIFDVRSVKITVYWKVLE
jgi:hypothetical protein